MPPQLSQYLNDLPSTEKAYALRLWEARQDTIGSAWPEREEFGLSLHRSLEIAGVLEFYHDRLQATQDRQNTMLTV